MNKKNILIPIALFTFSHLGFSAISGPVKMEGIIISYDKKTVTLSQKGKRIKVPRGTIPKHFKIKSGNQVYAEFNEQKLLNQLKKSQEDK